MVTFSFSVHTFTEAGSNRQGPEGPEPCIWKSCANCQPVYPSVAPPLRAVLPLLLALEVKYLKQNLITWGITNINTELSLSLHRFLLSSFHRHNSNDINMTNSFQVND